MPFCPECDREYPEGIVLCRACGTAVGEGSRPPGPEVVRLVPVCPVSGVVEASMLRGALESQGLHPLVVGHSLPAHGTILRDWSTRNWGEIRVPADEEDEARLVIEDFVEAVRRMPALEAEPEDAADPEPEGGEPSAGEPPADATTDPPRLRLTAVEGRRGDDEPPPGDAPGPSVLYPLCPVSDVAEAVMLKGALASQGLHPVLTGPAGGHAPWSAMQGVKGEIRVPREELLEARAVLEDFRRAVARAAGRRRAGRGEDPPADAT